MLAFQWPVPFILTLMGACLGVGVIGVGVEVRMPKKVREWTDRCRLTIQRCKFIYKVWSKCRNKENLDNLIRNGGLDAFSDKIMDFMKCDTVMIANRLKICGGIKGRAKTKVMRRSLIFLMEEIKKGFQRNMPYFNNQHQSKSLQKYHPVNAVQKID